MKGAGGDEASNQKYDVPRMKCPVAYSMDTAFFFKTIDTSEDLGVRHQLYQSSKDSLETVIRYISLKNDRWMMEIVLLVILS